MDNINALSNIDYNPTKNHFWKNLTCSIALFTSLSLASPAETKTSNIVDNDLPSIELVDSPIDIVWNVERRTGVKFPVEYRLKLQDFVDNNVVMQDENASKFTEEFIVNQLEADWGISKPNQSLFIRAAIYKEITNKNLYNGSDGDSNRLNEFKNAMNFRKECCQEYANLFDAHVQQRSADADRRSADADRRSADADRRSADADKKGIETTNSGLNNLIRFYNYYKEDPSKVKAEDIEEFKGHSKWIIQSCKEYGIDYKAKLPKEVRRFYGIE